METPIRSSSSQRRKPKADLYTALLALALVALLVAVLFLYLYMGVFEFKIKGAPTAAAFGGVQTQLAHCHSGPIHDIVF